MNNTEMTTSKTLPTEMELECDIEMLRMDIEHIEAKPRARAPLVRNYRKNLVKTMKLRLQELKAQLERGDFAPDYAAMRWADAEEMARAGEAIDACYDY
jgi:hypothetical protein